MKGEHESHLIFCQQPSAENFNSTFIVMSHGAQQQERVCVCV
jgi:hypothetical protein